MRANRYEKGFPKANNKKRKEMDELAILFFVFAVT
jgi:hypothetical protein